MPTNEYPLLKGQFPNYYELLGVSKTADESTIKKAYRVAQLENHPDKAGNSPAQTELSAAINNAKEVLTDAGSRARYDRVLQLELAKKPAFSSLGQALRSQGPSSKPASSAFNPSSQSDQTPPKRPSPFTSTPFGSGPGFGPEQDQQFPTDPQKPCPRCGASDCRGAKLWHLQDGPNIPCQFQAYGSSSSSSPPPPPPPPDIFSRRPDPTTPYGNPFARRPGGPSPFSSARFGGFGGFGGAGGAGAGGFESEFEFDEEAEKKKKKKD